jgi:hypothetical protein
MVALVVIPATARAQISPGPLSKAHASLSGPTHCVDCHDVAKRPPELKCLDCHQDIRVRLQEHRGLHPSLVGNDLSGRTCAQCHSEHNGAGFALIHWDTPVSSFDHRRAAYSLEGRHAKLSCRECHRPDRIPPAVAATISMKDLSRTFLGLERSCASCHADQHHGQFSGTCDQCHAETSWKGAARFSHGLARYPLAGAHEKVRCERCHQTVAVEKPYVKYKGLEFGDCTPCHRDPHSGAFKFSCSSCHSPLNWKAARLTAMFSHASTRFPLEGKHARLNCETCHKDNNFKRPVAFGKCADCHRKDPHEGQFLRRADSGDCGACHTVSGFNPSTFTVQMHRQTSYPLEERHVTVACSKCHQRRGKSVNYVISDTRCQGCHSDVHQGQFQDSKSAGKCDDCHTLKRFKPSSFTLARHENTRFRLDGGHAAVVCGDCHRPAPPAEGDAGTGEVPVARFRFHDRGCGGCHKDPHRGEFTARMTAARPDGTPSGCESCHVTRSWHDLGRFDHSTTEFPLEGSHRVVGCGECHKSSTLSSLLSGVAYKAVPRECTGCHEDPHAGQFARDGVTACHACHVPSKWKLTTFDHELGSSFSLRGAHRAARCAACHVARRNETGNDAVQYKGTPHDCVACHGTALTRG